MGLIDRILNGEFDDENESLAATKPGKLGGIATGGKSKITDPDEDEDELDDEEETPRDDFEDLPSEEVDDCTPQSDDIPDDEFMMEYAVENGIEVIDETELVGTAPAQYVEKPKQSKVREINKKSTMTDTTNNTTGTPTTPKQSTTKTESTGTKKRGAPHKLAQHTEEVCRLYNENVGAKLIAEKFGVSVSCVINTLKRSGVTIRSKGRRKTAE